MLRRASPYAAASLFSVLGCMTGTAPDVIVDNSSQAIVAGAGYTTFDAVQGGCNDSPNGVNCNNYQTKGDVYASGGPAAGGLSDGTYFFAVLAPGTQNGGFLEGATGNLSDTVPGAEGSGDYGSGDDIASRTFTVVDHQIVLPAGTHPIGSSPVDGHVILALSPYDDTPNTGGVYIMAICRVGAGSPQDCKYDAFRVHHHECEYAIPMFGVVRGAKYYDANANGQRDCDEPGVAGWPIDLHDGISETVTTGADGSFEASLIEDDYTVVERAAGAPWFQTGNLVNQTVTTGGAGATLNDDKTYTVHVVDNSVTEAVVFGNLCVGAGGGHTLGFWSNKNGQALIGSSDMALLVALNLRDANGAAFDPASPAKFRTWLLGATATNMAYMLSAQLAAMSLNVHNGLVGGGRLLYAPGTDSANANGFGSVEALVTEADAILRDNGVIGDGGELRARATAVKDALDQGNNNLNFVQPSPATCPAPVFAAGPY